MRVRVKVPFPYGGRDLKIGDEPDMPDPHARVLRLIGKVEDVEDDPPPDKRPRHRYGRRDLRAET